MGAPAAGLQRWRGVIVLPSSCCPVVVIVLPPIGSPIIVNVLPGRIIRTCSSVVLPATIVLPRLVVLPPCIMLPYVSVLACVISILPCVLKLTSTCLLPLVLPYLPILSSTASVERAI